MKIIPLSAEGKSSRTAPLGDALVTLVTLYNYSAQCWALDLFDADGTTLLTGLMLVPDVDLLRPYPAVAALLGALVLRESAPGNYQSPDLLGTGAWLQWYAPGEAVT